MTWFLIALIEFAAILTLCLVVGICLWTIVTQGYKNQCLSRENARITNRRREYEEAAFREGYKARKANLTANAPTPRRSHA